MLLLSSLLPLIAYLAPAVADTSGSQHQHQQPFNGVARQHIAHPAILESIDRYPDPVDALVNLEPALAGFLAAERLIHVAGADSAVWMTEGDKLRLKRENTFFVDITDRPDATLASRTALAGKAHLPDIDQQRYVRPCFADVSTDEMRKALTHLTGFYNRYYHSTTGERSARWLHDRIAEIIAASPFQTYISLNYHTHTFPQPSLVARFEPPHLNASLPVTIIGAHQDSANYLFPLLPAPGADDDGSGTVSILEAFRVLATRGFVPRDGPVEFHWYAAEEAGLLGSLDVAGYRKDRGEKVGAMMEFDMTAFIARNVNESITLVKTQADPDLTEWCAKLAREYIDLPVEVAELGPNAGSDYMSWTRLGYPSAFACEGDPLHGGFPGDFDPYVHGDKDVIDIDDERGVFSFDHMAHFSELAIAFVVEQAGWSLKHTRAEDGSKPMWDTMSL